MKNLMVVIFICSSFISEGQQTINVLSDYLEVNFKFADSIYAPTGEIIFYNRQAPYTGNFLSYGLHVTNHGYTKMNNLIRGRFETDTTCTNFTLCEEPQWYDSPLIGVHGSNTVLYYSGVMRGDNSRSDVSIVVTDTGRFIVGKNAYIDLVFSRWTNFTRSIYVHGDGTGVFEIEDGFVSDRSALGTKPCGTGALRFNKAIFVSNSSEGLPYYYRPKLTDTEAKINSHLVFENQPGSKWIVQHKNQSFPGGFWIYENMELQTNANLTLTGKIDTFKYNEYYVNYGGMMFFTQNRTVTKSGPGTFVLAGDQAYASGSVIVVTEGRIEFVTDPFMYGNKNFTQYKTFTTGKFLTVQLTGNSQLKVTASRVNLQALNMSSAGSSVYIKYGSVLHAATATLNGSLVLVIPSNVTLQVNDIVAVTDFTSRTGKFVVVKDSAMKYLWDTTRLYTNGELKVSGIVSSAKVFNNINDKKAYLYPNPSNGVITIDIPDNLDCVLLNVYKTNGVLLYKKALNTFPVELNTGLKKGDYWYDLQSERNNFFFSGNLLIR